jgi:hypothetical protein
LIPYDYSLQLVWIIANYNNKGSENHKCFSNYIVTFLNCAVVLPILISYKRGMEAAFNKSKEYVSKKACDMIDPIAVLKKQ